jgi:hypothetical protein
MNVTDKPSTASKQCTQSKLNVVSQSVSPTGPTVFRIPETCAAGYMPCWL